MDASRYISIVRRWGWLLVLGAVFSLATYVVASRFTPEDDALPRYEATASLLVSADATEIAPPDAGAALAEDGMASLARSYAEMIDGDAVTGRLAALFGFPGDASVLGGQISADVVPSTQLVRVTATGATPDEATTIAQGAAEAFMALHDEQAMPGSVYLYETSRADVVPDSGTPVLAEVLIVLFGGLLAAAAVVLAFEFLTDKVRAGEDAAVAAGLPLVAAIPAWNAKSIAIATDGDRAEDAEEAYRDMRTAVALATLQDVPETVLFTAPREGAGASTTAANYAAALAQAGRTVALVDADMRAPSLHRIFGLEDGTGLAQALQSDTDVDAFIQITGIHGLALLAAGGAQEDAPELLASDRFGDVLVALEERYDTVIIDAPPTLAFTDATLIAAKADATIVVARADSTTRGDTAATVEMLKRASRLMPGVVLNAEPGGILPFARGVRPLAKRRRASALR